MIDKVVSEFEIDILEIQIHPRQFLYGSCLSFIDLSYSPILFGMLPEIIHRVKLNHPMDIIIVNCSRFVCVYVARLVAYVLCCPL